MKRGLRTATGAFRAASRPKKEGYPVKMLRFAALAFGFLVVGNWTVARAEAPEADKKEDKKDAKKADKKADKKEDDKKKDDAKK
jgi:hypothetical protein